MQKRLSIIANDSSFPELDGSKYFVENDFSRYLSGVGENATWGGCLALVHKMCFVGM